MSFVFGLVGFVAGVLAELLGAIAQDPWAIRLTQKEKPRELDEDIRDGRRVEYPAPSGVLGDESACYGSDSRA